MRHLLSGWIGHFFGAGAAALAVGDRRALRLLAGAARRAVARPGLSRLPRLHPPHGPAAAWPCSGSPTCTSRRSRRWPSPSTPPIRARDCTCGASSGTRRSWRAPPASATTRSRRWPPAAMLHDIGMLAVPQHILAKREGLTDDERRKLWLHPQVGADIIHAVPFPSPVAPLILEPPRALGRPRLPRRPRRRRDPARRADHRPRRSLRRAAARAGRQRRRRRWPSSREDAGRALDPELVAALPAAQARGRRDRGRAHDAHLRHRRRRRGRRPSAPRRRTRSPTSPTPSARSTASTTCRRRSARR